MKQIKFNVSDTATSTLDLMQTKGQGRSVTGLLMPRYTSMLIHDELFKMQRDESELDYRVFQFVFSWHHEIQCLLVSSNTAMGTTDPATAFRPVTL
jgi:hypothetical protein